MGTMKDQFTMGEDKTMLTRQQKKRKDRKFYKAFVWVAQITFVILCLTAMVSITIIGLIG
jgi:hypothetical protein